MPTKTTYTGRMDYGIGIHAHVDKEILQNSHWSQILTICEPKRPGHYLEAMGQLLTYLGSVYCYRKEHGSPHLTLHGLATDGHMYYFIKINPDGDVFQTKTYDAQFSSHRSKILTILSYLLQKTYAEILRKGEPTNDHEIITTDRPNETVDED